MAIADTTWYQDTPDVWVQTVAQNFPDDFTSLVTRALVLDGPTITASGKALTTAQMQTILLARNITATSSELAAALTTIRNRQIFERTLGATRNLYILTQFLGEPFSQGATVPVTLSPGAVTPASVQSVAGPQGSAGPAGPVGLTGPAGPQGDPGESVNLSAVTPQPLGSASAGIAVRASRDDHVHAHGDQAGGSLHVVATVGLAGFMSPQQVTDLAALVAAPPPTWTQTLGEGNVSGGTNPTLSSGDSLLSAGVTPASAGVTQIAVGAGYGDTNAAVGNNPGGISEFRGTVGSGTGLDTVSWNLAVVDGVRNPRAKFFLTDATAGAGAWGLWETFSSAGNQPFVVGVGGTEIFRILSTGEATLINDLTLDAGAAVLTVGDGTANPAIELDKVDTNQATIVWRVAGSPRWILNVDAGEDLRFNRRDVVGASVDEPLVLDWTTGNASMANALALNGSLITQARPDADNLVLGNLAAVDPGLTILGTNASIVRIAIADASAGFSGGWVYAHSGDSMTTILGGTTALVHTNAIFRAGFDDTTSLGTAAQRWSDVRAMGGIISGDWTLLASSPTLTVEATGTPIGPIFQLDKVDTAESFFRWLNGGVRLWQWRLNTAETLVLDRYNAAGVLQDSPVTISTVTGGMLLANGLDLDSGSPTFSVGDGTAFPVVQINKGEASEGIFRFQSNNLVRGEILQIGNEDMLFRHRDAGQVVTSITTYANATGNWSFPASILQGAAVIGDAVSGADNIVLGDAIGSNGITIRSGSASQCIVAAVDTAGVFQGGWRYDHSVDEMQFIAVGGQQMGLNSSRLSLAVNLNLSSASPTLTAGDGTGTPAINFDKLDSVNASWAALLVGGVGRWIWQFQTNENLALLRRDVVGAAVDTPILFDWTTGGIELGVGDVATPDSSTATPADFDISAGSFTGAGVTDFDGAAVTITAGSSNAANAGARGGDVLVRAGDSTGAGAGTPGGIELLGATAVAELDLAGAIRLAASPTATYATSSIQINSVGDIVFAGGNGLSGNTPGRPISATAGDAFGTAAGGAVTISAGAGSGTAGSTGGAVVISSGNASGPGAGDGGALTLSAGDGSLISGLGGAASFSAGNGGTTTAAGGDVTIAGGTGGSTSGDGGDVVLSPGTVTSGTEGMVVLGNSSTMQFVERSAVVTGIAATQGRLWVLNNAPNELTYTDDAGTDFPVSLMVAQRDQATTDQDVVNTVTETTVYSYSVPAGAIGANGSVRVKFTGDYLNNSGGNDTYRLRVNFGATEILNILSGTLATRVNRRTVHIDFELTNQNATNDQTGGGTWIMAAASTATTGTGTFVTDLDAGFVFADGAEDTTAARTIEITVEHTTANANISFRRRAARTDIVHRD